MACRPGEENVATLFGDVHYFYGPPTDSPPHHRFDRGSYVYLFEDASQGRARIEIANRPGTEEQDAFDGFLDRTHVHYSYKHMCMVSIAVGGVDGYEEWHLPTYDPRNEAKYHYKLHALDIYFWTQRDALQFVNGVRRVLPPDRVDVQDEPAPPPPRQHEPAAAAVDMSSVVQKLENAAISGGGGSGSGGGGAPPYGALPSFAPPPLSAVSANSSSPAAGPLPPPPGPPGFAPMAYNPAAPAAPEAIAHREKTPPPDDGGLDPIHATLAYDATTPFSPGLAPAPTGLGPLSPGVPPPQFHPPPGAPSFPAPPQHSVATPGLAAPAGFGSLGATLPPQAQTPRGLLLQHPGLARAATMPVHGAPSPGLGSPFGSGFPVSPGFAPPPAQHTPTPPAAGPGMAAAPPPPPGGFSHYSYTSPSAPPAVDYGIHQQAYRPTEGETAYRYKPKAEVRGRLEEGAGKLERGVTGVLKRFEKKFG